MYGQESAEVLRILEQNQLMIQSDDGRKIVKVKSQDVSITKSDGTSLYITRDLAAAMDRWKTFRPDKMYYVVESGQSNHLQNLFKILEACKFPWSSHLEHVRFGRISGMSTRKGTAVFLKDILDEGYVQMLEKLDKSR
jgi:arginyl-tRNA synthetase